VRRASIIQTINRARRASATRLLDSCVFTRGDGDGTLDAEGVWTPTEPTLVYAGPCWVGKLEALTDPKRRTDQMLTDTPFTIVVPWNAARFEVGDVGVLTSSRDPYASDRVWRVTNVPTDSWQVETRLPVEEVIDGA
jgi:hypothetical protein